jgi:Arm DNA-binding domain/Phage integrase, N-terminal SAM-like domain
MGSRKNVGLSDTRIRAAKPRSKAYKLPDGNGLHLEISPSGARLWRYRYRIGGKENVFAIGSYPDVSLGSAREERDLARALVKRQIHPSHNRKTERIRAVYEGSNTFKAVALEWLAANKPHWAPRSHRQRERILDLDILPHVGALPMRQVTPAHAHAILKRIESRAPQMAVLARQCISAISRLAVMTMRADVDVAYPLRSAVKVRATRHKTPLRVNQIPSFFETLERSALCFPTKAGLQLMWLTLARPVEVIGASWEDPSAPNEDETTACDPTPRTGYRTTKPDAGGKSIKRISHSQSYESQESGGSFAIYKSLLFDGVHRQVHSARNSGYRPNFTRRARSRPRCA